MNKIDPIIDNDDNDIEQKTELITSMLDVLLNNFENVKSFDKNHEDLNLSDNFSKIYKSCKENNYDDFITLVNNSTIDDLTLCLHITNSLPIVKYILDTYKIESGIIDCYKNAIQSNNILIIDYLENNYTKYIISNIESDSEDITDNSTDEDEIGL